MESQTKKLLVTLTVSEGKRLIAKGLLATDTIQNALHNGYLCITLGTTSSYLVEEILGNYDKSKHIAGVTVPKGVWTTKAKERHYDAIFHKGKYLEEKKVKDVLAKMGPEDVIIKSANTIDADFTPLVLLASQTGGTVGSFLGAACSRNIQIVMPCGLEKLIPARYSDFIGEFGKDDWDFEIGTGVGIIAIPEGILFSEIEAFEALFDVTAVPISAGGVNGAEGSYTFFIEGEAENVEEAYMFLLKEIKGEPPFPEVTHLSE